MPLAYSYNLAIVITTSIKLHQICKFTVRPFNDEGLKWLRENRSIANKSVFSGALYRVAILNNAHDSPF